MAEEETDVVRKKKIAEDLAEKLTLTKKTAGEAVDFVFEAIKEAVATPGVKVQISDFGGFEAAVRQAREGRNPATQAPLHIPASYKVAFTDSKAFKDYVKEKLPSLEEKKEEKKPAKKKK
jgi:DNA-binding protein HU-beta